MLRAKTKPLIRTASTAGLSFFWLFTTASANPIIEHVIHISVDGFRADAVTTLGPSLAPNFYRLRAEGTFTDNARTDPNVTVTMANHVGMFTGRGQLGTNGHLVTRNSDPGNPTGALGRIAITTNPGEFVRGTGALCIDDGGASNYLNVDGDIITNGANSNIITISTWFKFEDIGTNGSDTRNALWETSPGDYSLSFGVRSDTPDGLKHTQWFTETPSTGGTTTNLPVVDDGLWHHTVVIVDEIADNVRYYFDGVLVDNTSIPGLVLDQANATGFHIGSHRAGDGSRNWDGFIDDMAVFDYALSSNQVAALYTGSLNVASATGGNLIAYWPFDADYASTTNNHLYQGTAISGNLVTVHSDCANAGGDDYVPSIYDHLHDRGHSTAFYAGWDGFNYLDTSWNADSGASDTIGPDNGTDKIDTYVLVTDDDLEAQTTTFLADLATAPPTYSFLHLHLTDTEGHAHGYLGTEYLAAVEATDLQVGRILDFVKTNATLRNKTAIILTSDHGGIDTSHGTLVWEVYAIPFYLWGPGVEPGQDLYALNWDTRPDPGLGNPSYSADPQPIRNGDVANLALDLLGYGPLTTSTINASQDLRWANAPTQPPSTVRSARVQVAGSGNASTAYTVLIQSVSFDISFDNNNFGDHELYSGGARLQQASGLIIANPNHAGDSIVEVGGDLTYTGGSDSRYNDGMAFATADQSGGGEKNFDFSFAHFPFDGGWIGAHIGTDGTILAGPNLPAGSSITNLGSSPSWRGSGHFAIHLPGIDSRTNGLLFVVGGDNDNNVAVAGIFEDTDDTNVLAGDAALGDWHVQLRDASHNDTSDVGESGTFSFLYLPSNTANLVGGRVEGDGDVLHRIGTFTASSGAATGQVDIQIPNGQGGNFSDQDGILILTCSAVLETINSGNNQDPVDGNALTWTYDAVDEKFVVHAFDAPNGAAQDVGDFVFAFIPYEQSLQVPLADLAVEKLVDSDCLLSGSNLTYTITVTNSGIIDAHGVTVTDTLPTAVMFLSSTPTAAQTNENSYIFSLDPIGAGQATSVVINTVVISPTTSTMLFNTASAATTNAELSYANNSDMAMTFLPDTDGDSINNVFDLDDDNDGMTDEEEDVANTDPLSATSFLWLAISPPSNQGTHILNFPASTGRTYHIQSITNLLTGSWQNTQSNIPGTNGLMSILLTNAIPHRAFRVLVERP